MRGKLVMVSAVMFLGLSFGLMVADVQAFCVYNYTDKDEIRAAQTSGGIRGRMFAQTIPRNESRCCNWQNSDCNTARERDAIVLFAVYDRVSTHFYEPSPTPICADFAIKAGGWLEVTGKDGKYECKGYYE